MTARNNRFAKWKPEDKLGYVITGRELETFAANLRVSRAHRIAYLLRNVAGVLDKLAGQDVDKSHLQLIRQLAKEENHKQFRKLMTRIVNALRQGGEKGRRSAKLTITRYLEILLDEPLSFVGSITIRRIERPAKI
jgi:hypothetical protein